MGLIIGIALCAYLFMGIGVAIYLKMVPDMTPGSVWQIAVAVGLTTFVLSVAGFRSVTVVNFLYPIACFALVPWFQQRIIKRNEKMQKAASSENEAA